MRILFGIAVAAAVSSATAFAPRALFGVRSSSSLMMSSVTLKTGTVKWFDSTKGYGFITSDDGAGDVFVHQSSIEKEGFRSLEDGEMVRFHTEVDEKSGKVVARGVATLDIPASESQVTDAAPPPRTTDDQNEEAATEAAKADADEEARLKAESEAKAAEEAKARAEEEARLKAEAEAKAAEEAKARAEEEARLKAEAEAKAAEEAKARAEEEARLKAEAEAKAAEEAKARAEEEARLKAEAEAKAAEEAKARAEEEARLKAEAEAKAAARRIESYGEMSPDEGMFAVLSDLGVIGVTPDPSSSEYDNSFDDNVVTGE